MLAWLERHQLVVAGFACLLLLAGVVVPRLDAGDRGSIVFREGSGLAPGTPIRVHVTGAVVEPGVYELGEGDRVAEALAAAGGPAGDADIEGVNLARRLRDEGQVVIPRRAGASAAAATLAPGQKVDINTANEALLDQLPGIGEAYSRRIVDSRKLDGPFRTTQELVDRRVIPRATFEEIRELVTAGP